MIREPSKFLVYKESTKRNKYWANYTDENVLLHTYQHGKPWADLTDPVMDYVSTAVPGLAGKRTPLQDFLKENGQQVTIDSDYVKWRLRGTGEVQARAKENLEASNDVPGIQNSEFRLHLDVPWFVPGDVLAPDVAKDYQVVVQSEAEDNVAEGYVYTVQMSDRDPNRFYPPELLAENIKWIKIDSVYGEGSSGYGSTIYGGMSYIEFKSELTDYGKSVEVTNKAHDLNLRVVSADEKNRAIDDYPDQIISMIEAKFLAQARWEKELRLYYGRSAGKQILDNTIGNRRRIGPGLLEFLEDGNVVPYPLEGGSHDMFTDKLQAVWFDRVAPENRNVVILTGQGGMTQWKDWVTEKFAVDPISKSSDRFVGDGKSFDNKNWKGLKYPNAFFTETALYPFGSATVKHWPILDSEHLNGSVRHPRTGLPLSSYEYIVLDFGLGTTNIELIDRRDSKAYTYKCGTWSPQGAINKSKSSAFVCTGPERRYQLFLTDTFGIRVKDVTLTMWFKPAVQM